MVMKKRNFIKSSREKTGLSEVKFTFVSGGKKRQKTIIAKDFARARIDFRKEFPKAKIKAVLTQRHKATVQRGFFGLGKRRVL